MKPVSVTLLVAALTCPLLPAAPVNHGVHGAANSFDPISISAARQQGLSAIVTVGPMTVSTTNDMTRSGYAFAAQDATAGITIYGSSNITVNVTNLLNQGVKPGDRIVLQGSNVWYHGLYEIMEPMLVTNLGPTGVPAATPITMNEMQDGSLTGETVESMSVVLSDVFIATNIATFVGGNAYYTLTNTAGQSAIMRILDLADPLVGTPVPSVPCEISGLMSQYSTNLVGLGDLDGRQILPLVLLPLPEPALLGLAVLVAFPARKWYNSRDFMEQTAGSVQETG